MLTQLRGWITALAALALTIAGAAPAATPHEIPARPPQTAARTPQLPARPLPLAVDGGSWRSGHLQGMALDRARRHLYFSFTDMLVKTDLSGRPLGSVRGIGGHLGDLDFDTADGRVYGSLEYGRDAAFYIAVFDGRRITRMNMDARTSGVLTTVHLGEVARDFTADMDGDGVFDGDTGHTADHRYGNAGIDGVAFGPAFGTTGGPQMLTVAYGVYTDTARRDNDHQVLLQYDVRDWRRYERPLNESRPHRSGPAGHDGKYFVYTGNTTYGVQNLEYDGHSGIWLMAVYRGAKRQFPNYGLFAVDAGRPPVEGGVRGQRRPERGMLLSLLPQGEHHAPSGTYGWHAPGQFGLVSLDDGRFYVGESAKARGGTATQTGKALLHRWTGRTPLPFAPLTGSGAATG
ncbi:hypothetical protein HW130_10195 [Streptomyces sp. PKU-EA00015]|uniref:hypothetical protein n=1 Tax=Streptomyces sp. PKU-EA00015 TaxID=2748326 RepID=UPI0015A036FB|nr:hypothetical protein [Streptomyces sp. PKU-EA00015]NWF26641.1 hypothetical protein [Streptomyces sp. PKU-EA00015]